MGKPFSRRNFIRAGGLSVLGAAGAALARARGSAAPPHQMGGHDDEMFGPHGMPTVVGEVDHARNGFNPTDLLTDFDYGEVSTLPNGQTLHEYTFLAQNKLLEVAPGIEFQAWAYNGRVPGPTIRCTEGDRIRINFVNGTAHPHTIHFHGIHSYEMDGVPGAGPGLIGPGESYTYEFDALPFGLHLYHCHAFPLARHIAKGLYGAFIVDPKAGRPEVDHEYVMVMNGLDVDFDDVNDFYAVNTIPFHYQKHPIAFKVGERVRLYLVNALEFDPVNSFHLHAEFFYHYPTGTQLEPRDYTDTIIQGQAERAILEFSYNYPGLFMFHAHVSEFAELGWTGLFEVTE
jgi:FtsP/CotA-like multicopper oxidase with cupredoxin domain